MSDVDHSPHMDSSHGNRPGEHMSDPPDKPPEDMIHDAPVSLCNFFVCSREA